MPHEHNSKAHGGNYLITLAEMIAMYLLCWSARPWTLIEWRVPAGLGENETRYLGELEVIQEFA